MTIKEFVRLLRAELRERLEGKSAWGKQQVLMLVETAIADVLLPAETEESDDAE